MSDVAAAANPARVPHCAATVVPIPLASASPWANLAAPPPIIKGTSSCIPSTPTISAKNSAGYSVAAPQIAFAVPMMPEPLPIIFCMSATAAWYSLVVDALPRSTSFSANLPTAVSLGFLPASTTRPLNDSRIPPPALSALPAPLMMVELPVVLAKSMVALAKLYRKSSIPPLASPGILAAMTNHASGSSAWMSLKRGAVTSTAGAV